MIRIYQRGDHSTIAEIFTSAIHEIASEVYSQEQCLAWSAREANYAYWEKRCELKRPFIAVTESEISGFLELDPDGHIDCAYINPKFKRQGIMTRLVQHAINTCFALGINRMHVEASICARPMLEQIGFTLISENMVVIKGVEILNYKMELIKNMAERADSPNSHAFGTFVTDPADAGSAPKASGSR